MPCSQSASVDLSLCCIYRVVMRIMIYQLLICISTIFCLISGSLQYEPEDNILIDCGSTNDTAVGDRVFLADNHNSSFLATPETILVNASSDSIPASFDSALYRTARILNGTSQYTFPIKKQGWHWIRLYFYPFANENFNLSDAVFSVSANNFTLVKNFHPSNSFVVKEYSLNIAANNLLLNFTPSANSFALLNALEVISLPGELIPERLEILNQRGTFENLGPKAMETVKRINMGIKPVFAQNDTLWRFWEADQGYMRNRNLVVPVSNEKAVNYTIGNSTENIAPASVYGTASRLQTERDPNTIVNATWFFEVDPQFDYFVRFHFCNILSPLAKQLLFFDVFLDSSAAERDLNLSIYGAPSYKDVLAKSHTNSTLTISIGPTDVYNAYPDGILNGLEIMKISNSRHSLDAADAIFPSSTTSSSIQVWIIVITCVGAVVLITISILIFVLVRRRRRKANVVYTTQEGSEESKHSIAEATISRSKMAYRFPFATVQEATDDFSESLVIGVGGFGKVYKGVFRDGTQVAVKRGVYQSDQGIAEFRTEIEMLSQFRHRHLVSFIGYCDEKNEMIIIYEYMDKGTLKSHLYGLGFPKLNWRQRLEICIGSAKGLHYLHTGSVKAIIHRDVKSANILLDENLMAKVADFGLSKMGPGIDQTHVSTAVKGSFGYLDPEYLIRQQLTEKSDVYSFGVVMLEVLSGRPVIDPSLPREMVNLVDWALKSFQRGELGELVDPYLVGDVKPESLIKFGETAEKCLAEEGADRPTMGDLLWNLEFALRLQRDKERSEMNNEAMNNHSVASVSGTEFSMGNMGDLAGVSMSKVFLEMVNAEKR